MEDRNRMTNEGGGQTQGGQDERGRQDQGGKGGARPKKYQGGRQGQGSVPNPDDVDDDKSAGSFRRTADEDSKEGDEDDSEQDNGAHQSANTVLHSGLRNPK
jgi:hypothetical protein